MAYICTAREVAALRHIRKKNLCALQPRYSQDLGNFNPTSPSPVAWYSYADDNVNGNSLPYYYPLSPVSNMVELSSNFSLPYEAVNSGANVPVIFFQHFSGGGWGVVGPSIVILQHGDVQSSPKQPPTEENEGYTVYSVSVSLGFTYPLSVINTEWNVTERNKSWTKYTGYWKPLKNLTRTTKTCTNQGSVGWDEENSFFTAPEYSIVEEVLIDSAATRTLNQTSFDTVFDSDSMEVPPDVIEYATAMGLYGPFQFVTLEIGHSHDFGVEEMNISCESP